MRSLNDSALVPHRGQSAGRAVITPDHVIDRLLAASEEGHQACVCETSAIVLVYLFGKRPVSTAAICAQDLSNTRRLNFGRTFAVSD